MNDKVNEAVLALWGYMQLNQPVRAVDVMIVLGSRDDRVAAHAAGLLKRGLATRCVVTGGLAHHNDLLMTTWAEATEAEHFANVMEALGIHKETLLIESSATNTGQNATYSHRLLVGEKIDAQTLLVVTKPYMERRALATFRAQWPDQSAVIRVTSQGGSIEQYCYEHELYDDVVNIMVGDFQRILEYPKFGFQVAQPVPSGLLQAFETLKHAGFTKHLL